MGSQILGYIVFFIFIQSNQSLDTACASSVQECVISFQAGVQHVGGNATETCKQVDIFIACLDTVLQPCDLATRSSLLSAMDNLINIYEKAPYSCSLESKDNLALSNCTLEIGNCAAYDLEAKSTDNPSQGCSYHEIYKICMAENTTTCNGTDRTDINEALSNSTAIMTDCPFNCYGMKQCESTTDYSDNDIEASITVPSVTQSVNYPRNDFTTPSSNPSGTPGTPLTPPVEEQSISTNGDDKHTPTKPTGVSQGGKPNTNTDPFRTGSILTFTTKETTVNWDNYGNNGSTYVSGAVFLLVVSTLLAVMLRN